MKSMCPKPPSGVQTSVCCKRSFALLFVPEGRSILAHRFIGGIRNTPIFFVPEGHSIVAHRFNGGFPISRNYSPLSTITGVSHRSNGGKISNVPPGRECVGASENPPMNRWATIGCPSGTKRAGQPRPCLKKPNPPAPFPTREGGEAPLV